MQIGVDATCWQNARGYGRYARALLSNLVRLDSDNHYVFYMDSLENSETVTPEAEVCLVRNKKTTALAATAAGHRSFGDMWRMSRAMSNSSSDVLLFPTIYSYVPVISSARKIVMIMDIIAEKYPALTLPSWRARLFWKAKVAFGRWQADRIVTLSEYSRQGLMQHFKIAPGRISVVGAASDPIFRVLGQPTLTPALTVLGVSSEAPTVVYVGGFGPHKNLETLVAVFARLASRKEHADLRLVMVGEYAREVFHSGFDTIKNQVQDLGIAERVVFTGYLPDDELVVLLNLAQALVLPSLMEGFGLPAVEAASCGCPVIATTASPLPSLLGAGGLYVDPHAPEDLESALDRVLSSPALRREMRNAGLAAVQRITWEAAARQMMAVIQEAMTE